jgi:putative transposase
MNSEYFIDIDGKLFVRWNDIVTHNVIPKGTLDAAKNRNSKGWNIIVDPSDKRARLIELEPLKPEYKAKIIAAFGDPNAKPIYKEPELPWDDVPNKQLEKAKAMYNLVINYRRFIENYQGKRKSEAINEWISLVKLGVICQNDFKMAGEKLSDKTLYRWNAELKEKGNTIDAFITKREVKTGSDLEKEHKDTLIQLYCGQNQLSVSECIRYAQAAWKNNGTPIVNDLRCRTFLNEWVKRNAATATFLRKGIKALRDEVLPYIDRDEDSIKWMDVLVADGHVLNFQIVNPQTGKMCRPTLVAWVDMATRMPMGFEIMYTENTRSVLSAFRNACLNAGKLAGIEGGILPKAVYMDNGKSFKNKFFTESVDLESELGGLFSRMKPLGLEHVAFAHPYNARAKIIERVFRDFGEIERQLPTYCGINIENKPAALKRNEVWHREQIKKYFDQHGKPTLQGSYLIIKEWIDQFCDRESDGKYLKGQTPLEAACNHINEINFQSRTLSVHHFDYMIMHSKVSRLGRNGFNVGGLWYYNANKFTQMAKDDTEYIIKYDVLNPDKILVYHEDGSFWCSAGQWIGQKVHAMAALGSDADRDKVKASNHTLKSIEKEVLKIAKNNIHGEMAISNLALPEPELVAIGQAETSEYITTSDGRKFKLKYF